MNLDATWMNLDATKMNLDATKIQLRLTQKLRYNLDATQMKCRFNLDVIQTYSYVNGTLILLFWLGVEWGGVVGVVENKAI